MSAKKFMAKLLKTAGAVSLEENPHTDVLRTASPSLNFTFGNAWGLPRGYSVALWGPKKGGKSLIMKAFIGHLHQEDPEAIAVVYDAEMRWRIQMTPEQYVAWGIDPARVLLIETNQATGIFDHMEKEVWPMIQDGAAIKLVAIDSMSAMLGRRMENSETVGDQNRGDEAATIQDGLKRIATVHRQGKFGLILICQARAEQDPNKAKYTPFRMQAANALQHYCEYFMFVGEDKSKDGKEDLLGNKELFEDEGKKDVAGKAEKTAHKVKATMQDSSVGPKGRTAELTVHDHRGILNVHEEVFLLGLHRGVITKPTNVTYSYGGRNWTGKAAMVKALEAEPEIQKAIIRELMKDDIKAVLPQKIEPTKGELEPVA